MTPRSPFQRFMAELRRRHVPQTVAVYVVAAWATIQFADVVVPNLGWPQWVVTAVIIASAVGLPLVLLLAWFLEWGPDGVVPTPPSTDEAGGGSRTPRMAWGATIVVLAVAIVAAMVVAVTLGREGVAPGEVEQAAEGSQDGAPTRFERRQAAPDREVPAVPDLDGLMSETFGDSVTRAIGDSLSRGIGEGRDLDALVEMATRIGAAVNVADDTGAIRIASPNGWRFGAPHPVSAGDTIRIQGVARTAAGVVAVEVAGRVVAESDGAREVPFEGAWVAGGTYGPFEIPVVVRTTDGDEIQRGFPVTVVP